MAFSVNWDLVASVRVLFIRGFGRRSGVRALSSSVRTDARRGGLRFILPVSPDISVSPRLFGIALRDLSQCRQYYITLRTPEQRPAGRRQLIREPYHLDIESSMA